MKCIFDAQLEKKRSMKKELDATDSDARCKGSCGSCRWPLWVVLMICELLIHSTRPSAIPSCIHTVYKTLYQEAPDELPSVNFVRECCVIVEVMGETMTAIKLANAPQWLQLWSNFTTRCQIPFTALIIGVIAESGDIDPCVVLSCIFMEDETSKTQVDGIVKKVNVLTLFGMHPCAWFC
jgi:hypothetical protein